MTSPRRKSPTVTLDDVARHAGVSRATASRVLNGLSAVSSESRARVVSAVESLGYTANPWGKALASGRSRVLGLMVGDLAAPDDLALTRAVMDAAAIADLRIHVAESRGDDGRRREAFARWSADGADAVIVLPDARARCQDHWPPEMEDYVSQGGRVVHVDTRDQDRPSSTLLLEEFDAAADLGALLARAGRRRFVVLARDDHGLQGVRAQGFQTGVGRDFGDSATISLVTLDESGPGSDLCSWLCLEGSVADCVFAVDLEAADRLQPWVCEHRPRLEGHVTFATFAYSGSPSRGGLTASVQMPVDVVAERALALAADRMPRALRVVGASVLSEIGA